MEPAVQSAVQNALAREQAEILYTEINRLPRSFRLPVLLCYFEGLTFDEAAHRLRCPAGTVRSRLARACDKLRRGLTRRGVSLSGASLVAVLSPRSASASVSASLCEITARAAMRVLGRTGPLRHDVSRGDGPCPRGAKIHARVQAEARRVDFSVRRRQPPPARASSLRYWLVRLESLTYQSPRRRMTLKGNRGQAGCWSLAGCSIHSANRWRMPLPWFTQR